MYNNFGAFLKKEYSFDTKILKSLYLGEHFNWEKNCYLIKEETIQDLINNMNSKFRSINKSNYKEPIKIDNFKTYYYAGTKSLRFYCNTSSPTGEVYNTNIFFAKVDYTEQDPQSNNYQEFDIVTKSGQTFKVWYEIPLISKNPAKIHCQCPDFAWRFSVWNKQDDYLSTTVPNYVKNYKKKTKRAPINPNKIPGICKHAYGFLNWLKKNNYIK